MEDAEAKEQLRRYMRDNKLNDEELASRLGIRHTTVWRWLTKDIKISARYLKFLEKKGIIGSGARGEGGIETPYRSVARIKSIDPAVFKRSFIRYMSEHDITSIGKFADALGYHRNTVYRWFWGKSVPSNAVINELVAKGVISKADLA